MTIFFGLIIIHHKYGLCGTPDNSVFLNFFLRQPLLVGLKTITCQWSFSAVGRVQEYIDEGQRFKPH